MKHTGHIDINQEREVVVWLFADPENLKHYQDGFIKKETVSGEAGQTGAEAMMFYRHGKHSMELKETIINNGLPDSFEAHYHHKSMDNTMVCRFEDLGGGKTRYHYAYEYTRIDWVMPKLISILLPSMYKKPAEKWLAQFKSFAEKHQQS